MPGGQSSFPFQNQNVQHIQKSCCQCSKNWHTTKTSTFFSTFRHWTSLPFPSRLDRFKPFQRHFLSHLLKIPHFQAKLPLLRKKYITQFPSLKSYSLIHIFPYYSVSLQNHSTAFAHNFTRKAIRTSVTSKSDFKKRKKKHILKVSQWIHTCVKFSASQLILKHFNLFSLASIIPTFSQNKRHILHLKILSFIEVLQIYLEPMIQLSSPVFIF